MKIDAMQKLRWPLAMLAAGALMTGCSGTTEEPTLPVEQALDVASNSSDAPEAANLMRGPLGLRSEAVEGFHCDASPDITYVDVCGQSLPATVHLEWTGCAMGRNGGGGMGPGAGGCDGGMYGAGGGGGMYGGGGGMYGAGSGPRARMGGRGFGGGTSSGTVDLTNTYATPDGCDGAIVQTQSATFNITRRRGDGGSMNATGTSTSTAELDAGGPPASKTTQIDVTRTRYDADGAVINSVHVTGTTTVAFSSDVPPVRTINGAYTEDSSIDGIVTVTLTDVVRPPRNVCQWPVSGTLTRVLADGTTHTLVYGPSCGEATLDGTAITLPERGRGGRHP